MLIGAGDSQRANQPQKGSQFIMGGHANSHCPCWRGKDEGEGTRPEVASQAVDLIPDRMCERPSLIRIRNEDGWWIFITSVFDDLKACNSLRIIRAGCYAIDRVRWYDNALPIIKYLLRLLPESRITKVRWLWSPWLAPWFHTHGSIIA